jgi:hypothetical protein
MWIENVPRRPDFCGRPSCPVCYSWADDDHTLAEARSNLLLGEQTYDFSTTTRVISGVAKMSQDLLGRSEGTAAEKEALQKAAEAIHERNLMSEDEKRKESMEEAGFDMQLAAAGAARRREQAAIAARPHKTIDQMDITKVEEEADKIATEQKEVVAVAGLPYSLSSTLSSTLIRPGKAMYYDIIDDKLSPDPLMYYGTSVGKP